MSISAKQEFGMSQIWIRDSKHPCVTTFCQVKYGGHGHGHENFRLRKCSKKPSYTAG